MRTAPTLRKMQRGKEVVKQRVKQSNLDLHSDLSLSALASSNSCGSLSLRSGRNAAVLASPTKTAKGVTNRPQRLPPLTSFGTSNQLGDSCSSDTDQESTSGGGTDREGRKTEAHSSEARVELQQVYAELLAIRDNMKVSMLLGSLISVCVN
jgi:hypothetical protein